MIVGSGSILLPNININKEGVSVISLVLIMGLFDNLKKKAEELAAEAGKMADRAKDLSSQVAEDARNWGEKALKDTSEWTKEAVIETKEWTEQAMKDFGDLAYDTWENKEKYAQDLKQWGREMPDKLKDYTDNFNVEDFWDKIADTGKKIGQNMIFMALVCYYAVMEIYNKDLEESDNNSK